MRASDYLLKRLADEGIGTAFLVYGGAISEVCDAFTRQEAIKYVVTIHEQAAGFAAEGYAKTKAMGLAIATSGPGGGNLVTAIQDCYYDSVPCIFITGQVSTQWINDNPKLRQLGFQETNIVSTVKAITKYAAQPRNTHDLRLMLETAIIECKSGRPGPVLLDIPIDVQKMEVPDAPHEPYHGKTRTTYRDSFLQYRDDLVESKRPAILAGGGAAKAWRHIETFAHNHGIPCFRTWNALDIVPDDMPQYAGTVGTYGGPGRNFGIQNCDLLLSLGCRMSGRISGGLPETFARGAKKYIVDIDLESLAPLNQQVKGDVNIWAPAEDFMTFQQPVANYFGDWLDQCRAWLHRYDPVTPAMTGTGDDPIHHYGFMRRLSELLPANAIVVSDTGGNQIMMGHCFKSKRGQRIFSSNGNTPMGFAMCGAIGAWFAEPTRPVICIIGDGGMQMNIQELQTMVNYKIPVKVFVINNGVLGNTLSYQRVNNMKEVACAPPDYSAPDFTKIARAYGIQSFTIPNWFYCNRIIRRMLEIDEPAICDVQDIDRCQYEPRISRWDVGIEDAFPHLPRDEFRANMITEPLEGWEKIA